jgi:hypothetical protein
VCRGRLGGGGELPLSSLLISTIRPTSKPIGKRPPRPEVTSSSPTLMSALIGMFGNCRRSMAPVP